MTVRPVDPHERQAARYATWRQNLARALGTSTPLAGISATGLERAVHHYRLSPDPDAWIVATLCGAELERRTARLPRFHTTGLTAAELAWTEQRDKRSAAA